MDSRPASSSIKSHERSGLRLTEGTRPASRICGIGAGGSWYLNCAPAEAGISPTVTTRASVRIQDFTFPSSCARCLVGGQGPAGGRAIGPTGVLIEALGRPEGAFPGDVVSQDVVDSLPALEGELSPPLF